MVHFKSDIRCRKQFFIYVLKVQGIISPPGRGDDIFYNKIWQGVGLSIRQFEMHPDLMEGIQSIFFQAE